MTLREYGPKSLDWEAQANVEAYIRVQLEKESSTRDSKLNKIWKEKTSLENKLNQQWDNTSPLGQKLEDVRASLAERHEKQTTFINLIEDLQENLSVTQDLFQQSQRWGIKLKNTVSNTEHLEVVVEDCWESSNDQLKIAQLPVQGADVGIMPLY